MMYISIMIAKLYYSIIGWLHEFFTGAKAKEKFLNELDEDYNFYKKALNGRYTIILRGHEYYIRDNLTMDYIEFIWGINSIIVPITCETYLDKCKFKFNNYVENEVYKSKPIRVI